MEPTFTITKNVLELNTSEELEHKIREELKKIINRNDLFFEVKTEYWNLPVVKMSISFNNEEDLKIWLKTVLNKEFPEIKESQN